MTVLPSRFLIGAFAAALAVAVGGLVASRLRGGGVRFAAAFALLGLATEVAVNATFRQPQGRHLFFVGPALALLAVAGWASLSPRRPGLAAASGIGAILLAHLGVFGARLVPTFHPLNAASEPYRVLTNEAERRLPTRETIEVEGPADGAEIADPPKIRWLAAPGAAYEVQLSVGGSDFGRPNWRFDRVVLRTYGNAGETFAGTFDFPRAEWAELPPGVPLYWRVVRLAPFADLGRDGAFLETSGIRCVRRKPSGG